MEEQKKGYILGVVDLLSLEKEKLRIQHLPYLYSNRNGHNCMDVWQRYKIEMIRRDNLTCK